MNQYIKVTVPNGKTQLVADWITRLCSPLEGGCCVEILDDKNEDVLSTTIENIRTRFGLDHIQGEPVEHEQTRVEPKKKARVIESGPIEMVAVPQTRNPSKE
jgi:hypothetical protein